MFQLLIMTNDGFDAQYSAEMVAIVCFKAIATGCSPVSIDKSRAATAVCLQGFCWTKAFFFYIPTLWTIILDMQKK